MEIPAYVSLLKKCIDSIREFTPDPNFDIVIICDADYSTHIENIGITGVIILTTEEKIKTGIEASLQKVCICNWHLIMNYKRVLYLDCDILVLANLNSIFDIELDHGTLYTFPEKYDSTYHMDIGYGLRDYTDDELKFLEHNNIPTFNCGHFMFTPSDEMKTHFMNVINLIAVWTGPYFYEQSFMNRYFNINGKMDYKHLKSHVLMFPLHFKIGKRYTINHFAGCGSTLEEKIM